MPGRSRSTAAGWSEPAPASASAGTQIEVRDLFFATPARLKFLRSDRAEANAIAEVVKRLALAAPGIRFTFAGDDRLPLDYRRSTADRRVARRSPGARRATSSTTP